MPAHEHLQAQLFDPATTRARDPGEVPFHEWLDQPNVAYHGTFNPSWQDAPYHHFGDVHAATERLNTASGLVRGVTTRQAYYSGETRSEGWDDDYEPEEQTHTGQVHARKLDLVGQRRPFSDPHANAAHAHAMLKEGYEEWEVPQSVTESHQGLVFTSWSPKYGGEPRVIGTERHRVQAGSRALQMGKGITYANPFESGQSGISHVAPPAAQSTWEGDVIGSKHASTMAKDYAKERVRKGEASTVPFERQGSSARDWQPTLAGDGSGHPVKTGSSHINKIQFTTKD